MLNVVLVDGTTVVVIIEFTWESIRGSRWRLLPCVDTDRPWLAPY